MAAANPADPGSWNRYSYAEGDPVNFNDPQGTEIPGCDPFWCGSGGPGTGCTVDGLVETPNPLCDYSGPGIEVPPLVETAAPTNPTCGEVLNLNAGNVTSNNWDLLGITSFFEDEAAGNPNGTVLSIWKGVDWTFENRANLTPAQAAAFYGARNIPTSFQAIVAGPTGSQVWSNGKLNSNFSTQLNNILGGSAASSLCTGLSDSIAIATGVTTGYIPNNVPGALQFASGKVIPGHGPGVVEQPVATFGNFTFYQPVYPVRMPRKGYQ
jgi:hypothetical protein